MNNSLRHNADAPQTFETGLKHSKTIWFTNPMIGLKVMAMYSGGMKMDEFCLAVNAPYFVCIAKNEIGRILWGVYQY